MLRRNLDGDPRTPQFHAQELADGVPTVAGLALLCSRTLAGLTEPVTVALTREAESILAAAAVRGVLEIRGRSDAFESSQRLLAVAAEVDDVHRVVFRSRVDPAVTMAYLEGFRELCARGLLLHQFGREFALTAAGFALARGLRREDYQSELEGALEEEI